MNRSTAWTLGRLVPAVPTHEIAVEVGGRSRQRGRKGGEGRRCRHRLGMSDDYFKDGEVVDERDEDNDAGGEVQPAQFSSLQRATMRAAK